MSNYHVRFWSPDGAQAPCEISGGDGQSMLEGFARAGRHALALRLRALPRPEIGRLRLTPLELAWIAGACGPVWLFVVVSYWLG